MSRAGRLAWWLGGIALVVLVVLAAARDWRSQPAAAPLARGLRLRLAPDGFATPGCANNDGPAVDFAFHFASDPSDALQGEKLLMPSMESGPAEEMSRKEYQRLLLERNLMIKVNTTLSEVLMPRRWEYSSTDTARNAITGGIFPTVRGEYDAMVSGNLLITNIGAGVMEGSVDVILQSGRWIREPFRVDLKPRDVNLVCG